MTLSAASANMVNGVAPDCHDQNFYDIDPAFPVLLEHYMPPALHSNLEPHI